MRHGLTIALASALAANAAACTARSTQIAAIDREAVAPGAHLITVTEPDPTVSLASAPLIFSAGPSALGDGLIDRAAVRCPAGMALVGDRVCVDKWEATLARVVDGKEEGWSPFYPVDDFMRLGVKFPFFAKSVPGVKPQGYISGRQAELSCRAAGKRLCSVNEWELACRGSKKQQFPYGNERRERVCNDAVRDRHPVIEATNAAGIFGDKVWLDGMNLPEINQMPDTLALTGSHEECVSEEGVFDMVGNLHEWVADADGTFRGGFYMDTTHNGDGCSYKTSAHDFNYHDYSTGFRCCSDPETID